MSALRSLVCGALVAVIPVVAQAQTDKMAAPTPGMIMGSGSHMAAGTIHVVGKMGAQQIHFTPEFKTDGGADLRAVLSSDMMAGTGSVDLGAVKGAGEQYVQVPKTVDATHFANLLIYDRKARTVVASTPVPGGMMGKSDGMMGNMKDSAMTKMGKKDSSMAKPY